MRDRCRLALGSYLVETAATMALVIPLCFYAIGIGVEACQVYGINQGLQQAAREAARSLATTFAVDPGIVTNTGDQTTYDFSRS